LGILLLLFDGMKFLNDDELMMASCNEELATLYLLDHELTCFTTTLHAVFVVWNLLLLEFYLFVSLTQKQSENGRPLKRKSKGSLFI
jgi:hypothetical protein